MRKSLILLSALVLLIGLCGLTYAGIAISKHDFTVENSSVTPDLGANYVTEICKPCHVPHASKAVVGSANFKQKLIWGQTENYNITLWDADDLWYSEWREDGGSQYQATLLQGAAARCMGCHGDISFYLTGVGAGQGYVIDTGRSTKLTNTLKNTHPVGVEYDVTALTVGEFKTPGTAKIVRVDSTNIVGCRSCHDPHNKATTTPFLVMNNEASALCLDCHTK